MTCWAIVPAKPFAEAKRRLLARLGPERARLAHAMADRVIGQLARASMVDHVLVVSDDAEAARLAAAHGAEILGDPGGGLNKAVAAGLAQARANGAERMLVVHADCPEITAAGIDLLLARFALSEKEIGLVPCRHGTGTNAVAVFGESEFLPQFGPDSFARHWQAAEGRTAELVDERLARDIDTPDDLGALAERLGLSAQAGWTERVDAAVAFCAGDTGDPYRLVDASADQLASRAATLRDGGHANLVTYSRKVFLPLTQLCRDVCHYCTFAKAPRALASPYMDADAAVEVARQGAAMGCKEALFTLGERPELRYAAARDWLAERSFASTLDYVAHVAARVRDETGLLPHINAGCMSGEEMAALRPVSASMGLMLESAAERLCEKGGPHYGSPDKRPAVRLATIAEAGRQRVPFTTGLLIGIGETRAERIDALLAIRDLHARYSHIQEVIVQNFAPKPGTKMAATPAASLEELRWTIAAARLLLGPEMSIQAPPNLSADNLEPLIAAGINDWGGVSPLTPDHVNPEASWPEIERLRLATENAGKALAERLTIYPRYVREGDVWLDPAMRRLVRELADGQGMGREDRWRAGRSDRLPESFHLVHRDQPRPSRIAGIVERARGEGAEGGEGLSLGEVATLFEARGHDYHMVCEAANDLRAARCGDAATYVVNRNINYTNICTYRCGFCAFSKGTRKHEGAEAPYNLDLEAIAERVAEASARGGTEVCLQGGIHPSFTGETYLAILEAVRRADPAVHIHAFSPLEVHHGATTLSLDLPDYLALLKRAGLGSLPGTAAEILHDPVRARICPDKLTAGQWLDVIEAAHGQGLPTTSTIMFGHADGYRDWAAHLLHLAALQRRTRGITEFVPLPFVAHEAPMYKRGQARPGPTAREAVLMHAVARLVLHGLIDNVQASWVKLGRGGMVEALRSGANDMGGTLMNESITRAAGATHGQEWTAADLEALAHSIGRVPQRRTTLYGRPEPATTIAGR